MAASYAIAPEGMYVNAPCPLIVPADKYILAVLNSKAADYYIRNLGVSRNGGYFEYKPMFVEQLPIPNAQAITKNMLHELVDARISAESEEEIMKIENKIENVIFELYGLDEEEQDKIKS